MSQSLNTEEALAIPDEEAVISDTNPRSSSGHSGGLDAQVIVSQVEDFYNKAFRPNQGSGLESSENIASGDGTPRQSPDGDPHSQVSHSLNPGRLQYPSLM